MPPASLGSLETGHCSVLPPHFNGCFGCDHPASASTTIHSSSVLPQRLDELNTSLHSASSHSSMPSLINRAACDSSEDEDEATTPLLIGCSLLQNASPLHAIPMMLPPTVATTNATHEDSILDATHEDFVLDSGASLSITTPPAVITNGHVSVTFTGIDHTENSS